MRTSLLSARRVAVAAIVLAAAQTRGEPRTIELPLQTRDAKTGQVVTTARQVDPGKIGIVIVDPWNYHWCMTWTEQAGGMVSRLNKALECARKLGMKVMWAPTDVSSMYVGTPQRERALAAEYLPLPRTREYRCRFTMPYGACHCGPGINCVVNYGHDGMPADLVIAEQDLIVCGTQELYSICKHQGITLLIYMGGAVNICLTGKPEGLKAMYEAGMDGLVARDLVEAWTHYDPARNYTPDVGNAESVVNLEAAGVPSINMVDEMRRLGLWDERWITQPIRITPSGKPMRPYFFEQGVTVSLNTTWLKDSRIHYTLDGSEVTAQSPPYERPLTLTQTTTLRTAAFRDARKVSLDSSGYFVRLGPVPPKSDKYLSDLKPIARQYPYGIWFYWPVTDKSYEGAPLTIRGKTYQKGLGMRAPANELYEVKPEFDRFVALAGVDDSVFRQAENGRFLAMHCSVRFHVFIDGQPAAQSPVMRISQEPWRFDVKIPDGARRIDLVATDAGSRSPYDLGNWVEAGFVLKKAP